MKRTLLTSLPQDLPDDVLRFMQGVDVYDSSSSPEARVYFIDRDEGYYLKVAGRTHLARECEMNRYFHSLSLGAEVLLYVSDERDYMLTKSVRGEDCTHRQYLDNPERLVDIIAQRLRMLHETDASLCPVQDRMSSYFALADTNYQNGTYDISLFCDRFAYENADVAYRVIEEGKALLNSRVLLHGDYCLPNIILDAWRFSGFIDLGNGGVGDRHIDLFWGVWTLEYNLHTDKYSKRFLDAYGRDLVDKEKLRIVAAAEVFG